MGFLSGLLGGGDPAMAGAAGMGAAPAMPPMPHMSEQGIPNVMGGINQSLAQNQQVGQRRASGGGGFRNVLGIIGDALLINSGHAPIYGPAMQQRRRGEALANALGQLEPGMAELFATDPGVALQVYKMKHPDAKEPPGMVQEYQWRQHLPENERGDYDKYVRSRQFNPFGAPITLGPNDIYEPGGGGAPEATGGEITATNPETGAKVRFNQQSGQWEPAGGATDQPSPTFPGQ